MQSNGFKVSSRHFVMYNQPIITVPVALFLGAGASSPFDKMLMGEFIDHLKNQDGFRNAPLFGDIVSAPEGRDLEHLFEELDEWSRKGYHLQDDTASVRMRGSPLSSAEPSLKKVAREASRMLEGLRKEVFHAYRNFQPAHSKELVLRFEALFGVLLKKVDLGKNPIVVFTTNYDPAIETFCQGKAGEYRLSDGFVPQWNAGSPVWHRESIDQLQLGATNQKDLVLFKLHGSTSWFKSGRQFIKSDAPIYAGADTSFENLLIYPAKKKVALDDPYFTAYDYFQRTLENCKLCVVIGYSFRDYDALSRLYSAASFNQNLKLLVLDPSASSLCKILRERGVTAVPLPKPFGDKASEQDYLTSIDATLSPLP
jgi:hypothetical protein